MMTDAAVRSLSFPRMVQDEKPLGAHEISGRPNSVPLKSSWTKTPAEGGQVENECQVEGGPRPRAVTSDGHSPGVSSVSSPESPGVPDELSTFSGARTGLLRQGTRTVAGFAAQPGALTKAVVSVAQGVSGGVVGSDGASGSRPHSMKTAPPSPLPQTATSPTTPASRASFHRAR